MKRIGSYFLTSLTLLAVASCVSKEMVSPEQPEGNYSYKVALDGNAKAVFDTDHIAWQSGDKIGWFTDKAGNSEVDMGSTPRSFTVNSVAALSAGAKIYAYAPYKAGEQSATSAPLSIPSSQDGDAAKDAMPLAAVPVTVTDPIAAETDTPVGTARFVNLATLIQYNIFTTAPAYSAEKVESVNFSASSPLAGSFTVDLTAVSEDALPSIEGLTQTSVTSSLSSATPVGASKETGVKVYQVIAPGTYSGTISVVTDQAVYTYALNSIPFTRSKMKPISMDLAAGVRGSKAEYMLTAKTWVLMAVKEVSKNKTTSAGNKLKLNADHSMTFDCSANGGQTYDHTWVGGLIAPDAYGAVSSMSWSLSSSGGKDYINVANGYLLVFAQEDMTGVYEIKELTDNNLTVEVTAYDEVWTLLFEAAAESLTPDLACPYWHTFANGDFGVGPVFDWGGWEDGYYFSMLTNPAVLDGATWSITNTGGDYFEWAGTEGWRKGIQVGTGAMTVSFKLSSSSFAGEITGVTLGYNSGITDGSSLSVSCTVGGTAFGSTVHHGEGDYEAVFAGSASGPIEISVSSSEKGAVYLYYVTVEYDPGSASTPEPEDNVEELLTAYSWELSSVTLGGSDVTQTAGNIMTLNANHSFSFDCTANAGKVYDYYYDGDLANPDFSHWGEGSYWEGADLSWSVSKTGSVDCLNFTALAYPLVMVDNCINQALSYEIVTLNSSTLVLHHNGDGGNYTITFSAVGGSSGGEEYTPPVSADEPPAGYSLVWNDEFTAGESLGGSSGKWIFETGGTGWGNNELQYYCANGTTTILGDTYDTAVVSEDGTLQINAIKLPSKVSGGNRPAGKQYVSARMYTKSYWKHGYFIMRAKLPVKNGCWPAFWMLPQYGSSWVRDTSEDGGELDIVEFVPNDNPNKIYFSAHSYYSTGEAEDVGDYVDYIHPTTGVHYRYTNDQSSGGIVSDPTAWHTYSMLWTDEFIRAYIDGEEYYYVPNPHPGVHNLLYWGFDQAFNLKLNLAVGGNWGGTPASDFGTQTFEIDYVRVYQR